MIAVNVVDFPSLRISKQLFSVPGAALDGGFTSGGARIQSPEPGGRGMLRLEPSLQVDEFNYPLASWLMSKINGEVFRVRLAPTPQIASSRVGNSGQPWGAQSVYPDAPWDNSANWDGDILTAYVAASLEGSTTVSVDVSQVGGSFFRPGHVIGHKDSTYIIDAVSVAANVAILTIKPPLRSNVAINDIAYVRPYFTGSIVNGSDMTATYDAENNGHIKLPTIIFSEVILP